MGKARWATVSTLAALVALACGGSTSPRIDPNAVDGGGDSGAGEGGAPPPPPATDSGAAGVDPGKIACGEELCNAASEVCCRQSQGQGSGRVTCQAPNIACNGPRLTCDEAADCTNGEVCCTEPIDDDGVLTSCRDSCVTALPRTQVCKTDAECKDGATCQSFDCNGQRFGGLKFCARPERCD